MPGPSRGGVWFCFLGPSRVVRFCFPVRLMVVRFHCQAVSWVSGFVSWPVSKGSGFVFCPPRNIGHERSQGNPRRGRLGWAHGHRRLCFARRSVCVCQGVKKLCVGHSLQRETAQCLELRVGFRFRILVVCPVPGCVPFWAVSHSGPCQGLLSSTAVSVGFCKEQAAPLPGDSVVVQTRRPGSGELAAGCPWWLRQ